MDLVPTHHASVPVVAVPTYVERTALTKKLEGKVKKSYDQPEEASIVVVTGASGSGKTQLVRNYIDLHRREFDTVLWLDATSKETIKSSFVRCCHALSLPFGSSTGWNAIEEAAEVSALLHWLDVRPRKKRWLVVIDGADDFSWDVHKVVPRGRAGTVVVTSQADDAGPKLGEKFSSICVPSSMSTKEAANVLYKCIDRPEETETEEVQSIAEHIARRLEKHPFSVSLAGAVIRVIADSELDLIASMNQYLNDSAQHRELLRKNDKYNSSSTKSKAIWLAWETSLASLKKVESELAYDDLLQLLQLLSLFDKGNIQYEIFRLAASSLKKASSVNVPPLLSKLLAVRDNGFWDDSTFRAGIEALKTHNLVQDSADSWPGISMHRLVQYQVERAGIGPDAWSCFLVLVGATALKLHTSPMKELEPHVMTHLPANKEVLEWRRNASGTDLGWICLNVGRVWKMVERYDVAQGLFAVARSEYATARGDEDRLTIEALRSLASMHIKQKDLEKACELQLKVVEGLSRTLGEDDWDTIFATEKLARIYYEQNLNEQAGKLQLRALEVREKNLDHEPGKRFSAMLNLGLYYRCQGRFDEAEKLVARTVRGRRTWLGEMHPETLDAVVRHATTCWKKGDIDKAKKLKTESLDGFLHAPNLGKDHPQTVAAMARLEVISNKRPRSRGRSPVVGTTNV